MPKLKCPVCGKRVIDFSDVGIRRQSELFEFSYAKSNKKNIDMVITCPNITCGSDIAICIKALHIPGQQLVSIPITGTVIS
jgi:hypothetical protein